MELTPEEQRMLNALETKRAAASVTTTDSSGNIFQLIPGGKKPDNQSVALLKDFVKKNGGKFAIGSGGGYYIFSGSYDSVQPLGHPLPGTIVNLEIDTADTQRYGLDGDISPDSIF